MNRDDFYKKLEERLNIRLLDNQPLYSQLNMFFDACDMDLRNGKVSDGIEYNDYDVKECTKKYNSEKLKYEMNIFAGIEEGKRFLDFRGIYNHLTFSLCNLYNENGVLQYRLELITSYKNDDYTLDISNTSGRKTEFIIKRGYFKNDDNIYENLRFYSNRIDFENVFGIIKSFIDNPESVCRTYRNIMNQKEVMFTQNEIDSAKKTDRLMINDEGKLLRKVKNV